MLGRARSVAGAAEFARVHSADVRLTEVSLHNASWLVTAGGDCAVIKQPEMPGEAELLRLLDAHSSPALRSHLVPLAANGRHGAWLRIAGVPRAETLRDEVHRSYPPRPALFARVGQASAQLHMFDIPSASEAVSRSEHEDAIASEISSGPPWVLGLALPATSLLTAASSGSRQLVAVIQQSGQICGLLADLQRAWAPTGLTHNDLTWDNALIHPQDAESERTEVKIIDWEMAGIGDPCWDVGTLLSEFVAFWALSIPVVGGEPYEELAKYPIEDMQPAMRAFWESYAEAMEFDRATARARLVKSVRLAGARLIQTAYERTQTMTQLTPHIYLLLQLSLNIMERPEDAAEGLFGIPLPGQVGT